MLVGVALVVAGTVAVSGGHNKWAKIAVVAVLPWRLLGAVGHLIWLVDLTLDRDYWSELDVDIPAVSVIEEVAVVGLLTSALVVSVGAGRKASQPVNV